MNATRSITAALLATALLVGCASDTDDDSPQDDVTETIEEDDTDD